VSSFRQRRGGAAFSGFIAMGQPIIVAQLALPVRPRNIL